MVKHSQMGRYVADELSLILQNFKVFRSAPPSPNPGRHDAAVLANRHVASGVSASVRRSIIAGDHRKPSARCSAIGGLRASGFPLPRYTITLRSRRISSVKFFGSAFLV
jgi:hypothetical protein